MTHASTALLALSAHTQGGTVTLNRDVTIGRADHCDIIVRRQFVSRLHARVTQECGRFLLADAGSVNGTFVNGRRLDAPHHLCHGDAIGLGDPSPALRFHARHQGARYIRLTESIPGT